MTTPERHVRSREWAESRGFRVDLHVGHIDVAVVKPDDVVMGTLPVNLAANVQSRGARYLHPASVVRSAARAARPGAVRRTAGARLEEYRIVRIEPERPR